MGARARIVRLAATFALAFAALVALPGLAAAAQGDWSDAEQDMAARINTERRDRGLTTLSLDLQLTRVARDWSATMAADDELYHNPRLATAVDGAWQSLGENVGYSIRTGATEAQLVERLHKAFMDSAGHKRNVLGDWTQVGVGVEVTDRGKMWVTVNFQRGGQPPTGAEQSAETVRTSQQLFADAATGGRTAEHVVLGRAEVFADSLAGAALAGEQGPILMTPGPNGADAAPVLHPGVRSEIDRLLDGSGRVYLLGGPEAVSERVGEELRAAGYDVARLAGPDRVATSVEVAREVVRRHGDSGEVLVATSRDWADAVSGGAYAAQRGVPVVLTGADDLDPRVAAFLAERDGAEVWALGGDEALADRVVRAAGAERVWGADRSATSVAIAEQLWQHAAGGQVLAVHGHARNGWVSALANAPRSAMDGIPQLLVGDTVPASVEQYLTALGDTEVVATAGVGEAVLTGMRTASGG